MSRTALAAGCFEVWCCNRGLAPNGEWPGDKAQGATMGKKQSGGTKKTGTSKNKAGGTSYWLLKSEPDSYSIEDLAAEPKQRTHWDGVRNYQARNFMRDEFRSGDRVLFYHSNAKPAGVAGTAKVVREAYPDFTAWDKTNDHYDPKSSPENPRWVMVDIQLEEIFPRLIPLSELREVPALKDMELLRKGSRLSVQPVRKKEFDAILKLARRKSS